MTTQWDIDDQITTAYLQGEEKGVEKGIEKEKAEIAKAMLDENVAPEQIARFTGLSVEEIAAL